MWQLRNEKWHGETANLHLGMFSKWARQMLEQIPNLKADNKVVRRAFLGLGIPYDYKCNIRGRWSTWKLSEDGNSLDFYLSEDKHVVAALCRDCRGELLFAISCDAVQDGSYDRMINYLVDMLKVAKDRGIKVSKVLTSHHLMKTTYANKRGCYFDEERRKLQEVMEQFKISVIEKISPMIIQSVICVSHEIPKNQIVISSKNLPRTVVLSISQDKQLLGVFCPTLHEDCYAANKLDGRTRDDNYSSNEANVCQFKDDTRIQYRFV